MDDIDLENEEIEAEDDDFLYLVNHVTALKILDVVEKKINIELKNGISKRHKTSS